MPQCLALDGHVQFLAQAFDHFGQRQVVLFFDPLAQDFEVRLEPGDSAPAALELQTLACFIETFPITLDGALTHFETLGCLSSTLTVLPRFNNPLT